MAEQNVEQVRVATTFRVHVAPAGTTLPTLVPDDAAAYESDNELDAAFVEVGFTSPDGSQFSDSKTTTGIPVHQRFRSVRTIVTEVASTAAFVMRQYDQDTFKLGFGGGEFSTPSAGITRYDPPDPSVIDRRVVVLDSFDGDIIDRYVIKRGVISGDVTAGFSRSAASDIPVTIAADEATDGQAWYFLTNDPEFASGS